MIVEELLELAKESLKGKEATEVRIGLSYTGVSLDDQSLGVAYSFGGEAPECCEIVDSAGELGGNALELEELASSTAAVDSSVGVATMNAAINREAGGEEGALLDFLNVREGDWVGMVGNFKPVAKRMEEDVELFVFERKAREDGVYPNWAAEQILPKVDVAIITGTAVVNGTIDRLLELTKDARETAILGPTTPMSPKVFRKHGVTHLGGTIVEDVEKALRIISQGGGARKLGTVSKKVSLPLKD